MKLVQAIWQSAPTRWALLTAIVLLVFLDYWGLSLFGTVVDVERVGTLGDWVAGLGSAGAVCVALYIANSDRREREATRLATEVRNRTKLYCWIARLDDEDDSRTGWYFFVNNFTAAPIGMWSLEVSASRTGADPDIITSRTESGFQPGMTSRPARLGPKISAPWCRLTFLDAAGDCWARTSDGQLEPLDLLLLGDAEYRSRTPASARQQYREPLV